MTAPHVVVVGSANIDYTTTVPQAPRPGETVLADGLHLLPGGKGMNQAVASARLGAAVTFIGSVGDDPDGTFLLNQLRAEGINIDRVDIDGSRRTGLAVVAVLPNGDNSIIVIPGANEGLLPAEAAAAVQDSAGPGTVVVVQAEIPRQVVESVARAAEAEGARLLINLAPYYDLPVAIRRIANPLVVNEVEAGALHGSAVTSVDSALAAARELCCDARSVVITLGGDGACWATPEDHGHVLPPEIADVVDTTGAGDAFVGALAATLAEGRGLESAVYMACRVGSFAVRGVGAQSSYPSRAEVEELVGLTEPEGSR